MSDMVGIELSQKPRRLHRFRNESIAVLHGLMLSIDHASSNWNTGMENAGLENTGTSRVWVARRNIINVDRGCVGVVLNRMCSTSEQLSWQSYTSVVPHSAVYVNAGQPHVYGPTRGSSPGTCCKWLSYLPCGHQHGSTSVLTFCVFYQLAELSGPWIMTLHVSFFTWLQLWSNLRCHLTLCIQLC